MTKLFDEINNINQDDRSLYSMLVDQLVGVFLNGKLVKEPARWLAPKTFSSEPNGGILTQSWLVVIKVIRESNIENLKSNAECLTKSKELIESIAGKTILWSIRNHEYCDLRRRKMLQ